MKTLADLRMWASTAPHGTLVRVDTLCEILGELEAEPTLVPAEEEGSPTPWRVLFWTVPAEVRIGRSELLEAVDRPASWLYRHTGPKAKDRIPHRKLDGELVFVVGEVRRWLRGREEIIEAGQLDGPRLRALGGGAP